MEPDQEFTSIAARRFRAALSVFIVLLVLAMYPFTPDPTGDVKRFLVAMAAFGFGIAWLGVMWMGILPFRKPPLFFGFLIAFLALFALASLRSEFFMFSVVEWSGFFALFVLYLVASQVCRTRDQALRLMATACLAVAAASLYGFLQKMNLDPFPWDERTSDIYLNVPATFGHPNFAAHTLILVIIMAALFVFDVVSAHLRGTLDAPTRRRGWIGGACLPIFLVHLRLTEQRAGLIALATAATLICVAVIVGRRFRNPVLGAACSMALVAALGLAGAGGAMALSRWRAGTTIPLDTSLLIRYQSYVSAADMFFKRPLSGHGPGVYAIAYPEFWTPFEQEWFAKQFRMNNRVHNDLMEVGIDAGVFAAGLYLAMLALGMGAGLAMAFRARDPARRSLGYAFAAFFVAFLIDGLFGFNLRVPVSATLLFLGMGMLEGLHTPAGQARPLTTPATIALRMGLLVALCLVAILGARVFLSQIFYQDGIRAHYRKDLDAARVSFERGLKMAPWDWQFERRLGLLRLAVFDPEAAIAHFERSLRANPYFVMTRLRLGHARLMVARQRMQTDPAASQEISALLDQAAADADQILELCPVLPAAHELLGRIASVHALQRAAVKDKTSADAATIEALWDRAEHHLEYAIQQSPEPQSELFRMLGNVRIAKGRIPEAEQALVRAIEADPADMETWPLLLDLAHAHHRYDSARNTAYSQIRRLNAAAPPNHDAIGSAYLFLANILETGYADYDGADAAYAAAVEHAPLRPEVWANFARYAQTHDRKDALVAAVAQSCARLAVAGEKPLPYVAAVNAVLQQGAAALEQASTILLAHVRAHRPSDTLTAAQVYGWAARILLETAQTADPADPAICAAWMNLGIVHAGMDELEIADRIFTHAERCIDTDRAAFLAIYWADALLRMDRGDEALARLLNARDKAPDNLDCLWAIARTYARIGRFDQAREAYAELLKEPDLAPQGRAMIEEELQAVR